MLIPNLKLDSSQQVRLLDYRIIHFRTTLYILAPFTNDGFPFHAILLGYLMPQAWGLPVQCYFESHIKKWLIKECFIM